MCFARGFYRIHLFRNVPLKDLLRELLERSVRKKQFLFPEKSELEINRSCKLTMICHYKRDNRCDQLVLQRTWWNAVISDTGDCLLHIEDQNPYGNGSPIIPQWFCHSRCHRLRVTTGRRPFVLVGDGAFQMTGRRICHCPRYVLIHIHYFQ